MPHASERGHCSARRTGQERVRGGVEDHGLAILGDITKDELVLGPVSIVGIVLGGDDQSCEEEVGWGVNESRLALSA